jgi:methylated-DNA-[protein]-cysteine S-methyltransferase
VPQPIEDPSVSRTVVLHAREVAGRWFGVARAGEGLVATAASSTRARTLGHLLRSLPSGVAHRVADDDRSEIVEKTIALLVDLEAGHEEHKEYSLATELIGEPLAGVLRVAAAIPIGYVTSYGNVAKASGADARDVGRIMASNPLYPIVPCHRVVGADLSLVGYSGSRGKAALRAKLARLARETRGFKTEQDVLVDGRRLRVYPVEWAIANAEKHGVGEDRQRSLFE